MSPAPSTIPSTAPSASSTPAPAQPGLTVVTGASGHVGANLVRALLGEGRRLRVVERDDTRALAGLAVERVRADVLDPASLERAFAGAEVVYHLAARISITGSDAALVDAVNVQGTRNVVAACLACSVRRLLHFSSIHAFSQHPTDQPLDEGRPPADERRALPYDRAKAGGEREVRAGLERGLDAVVVNPTAVLGPHDYKPSPMGEVLLDLYHRRLPALVDGGFDWVDVRDVVAGAIAAERLGKQGARYLLSGEWRPFCDLARLVEEATGARAPRLVAPIWLASLGAPFLVLWSRLTGTRPLCTPESMAILRASPRQVQHTRAAADLGYRPRPLGETIADTFAWLQTTGRLAPGTSSPAAHPPPPPTDATLGRDATRDAAGPAATR